MLLLRPFKVPHPLFSVIAQLVDIHHVSVPHHMGSIDKVAWESKIQAVKVDFLTCQKWNVVVVVVFGQDAISYHLPDLSDLQIELVLLASNTFSFL